MSQQQNVAFWSALFQKTQLDRDSVLKKSDTIIGIYSHSASCPFSSCTVLPSLISALMTSQLSLAIRSGNLGRLGDVSRRAGWDVKQLQAFKKVKIISDFGADPIPAGHVLLVDALDTISVEERTILYTQVIPERALLVVFSTSSTGPADIASLLHRCSIRIECSLIEPPSRDVHGRVSLYNGALEATCLFRATDSAMLPVSSINL